MLRRSSTVIASTLATSAGLAAFGLLAVALPASPALAQATGRTLEADADVVRITRPVEVLSGGGPGFYAFHTLNPGDVVERISTRNGFSAVRTDGPGFANAYAYIRVSGSDSDTAVPRLEIAGGRGTVDPWGRRLRTAQVNRPTLVIARMIDSASPADGWKSLVRLKAGTQVSVFGIEEKVEGVADTFHRTPMPVEALGFIPEDATAPATAAERQSFGAFRADPAAWMAAREAEAQAAEAERQRVAREQQAEVDRLTRERDRLAREARDREAAAQAATNAETATAEEDAASTAGAETTPPLTPPTDVEAETADDPTGDPVGDDRAAGDGEAGTSAAANDSEASGTPLGRPEPIVDPAGEPEETELISERLAAMDPEERIRMLESSLEVLQAEDPLLSELGPLRALYSDFARDVEDSAPGYSRYAIRRVGQLDVWLQLQKNQRELDELRTRMTKAAQDAADVIERHHTKYDFVGRLTTSRLMRTYSALELYRLESLTTGATVAYVHAAKSARNADGSVLDLRNSVQQIVGIRGQRRTDPGLQLDLVEVTRIVPLELMAQDPGRTPATDTDAGTGPESAATAETAADGEGEEDSTTLTDG